MDLLESDLVRPTRDKLALASLLFGEDAEVRITRRRDVGSKDAGLTQLFADE